MKDITEERLFASSDNFSSIDPVTNVTRFCGIDLNMNLPSLLQNNFPEPILPAFLHELTHHWCFTSPVGGALSLLRLRLIRNALGSVNERQPLGPSFFDDLVRYEAAMRLLRPLAEGLALFAEFDATPGDSDLISLPMEWVPYLFQRARLEHPDYPPEMRSTLNSMLHLILSMRLSREFEERKGHLLVQPLCGDPGGYLAGYMAVKNLWHQDSSRSYPFSDSDFFLTYARSFFYEDYGLVATILEPDLGYSEFLTKIQQYLYGRLSSLLNTDLTAHTKAFEKDVLQSPKSIPTRKGILSNTALSIIGERRLEQLLTQMNREMEVAKHNEGAVLSQIAIVEKDIHTFNHRKYLRIASHSTGHVVVADTRQVLFFIEGSEHPAISLPAVRNARIGEGKGTAEFFIAPYDRCSFLVVSREGLIVAYMPIAGFGVVPEDDLQPIVAAKLVDESMVQQRQFLALLEESLPPSHREQLCFVRLAIRSVTDELYSAFALRPLTSDKVHCVETMRDNGLWSILNEDSSIVSAYAHLGLTTSFRVPKSLIRGIDLNETMDILRACEERHGIKLVVDDENDVHALL